MKKSIIYIFVATTIIGSACNDKGSEEKNISGIETSEKEKIISFTIDGETIKGKVSTQYFGSNKATDNFSVLCQQDDPLVLLQATFANEKDAAKSGLTPKGFDGYKVNEGQYDLTLTPAGGTETFVATDKTQGAIKVESNAVVINNMKLFNREGKEKVVNATIKF